MKKYMKPVFNIAAAIPNPHPGNSCATSQKDLTLIADILQIPLEELGQSGAFAPGEGCTIEIPLLIGCKFTSVDANGVKAFLS